MYYAILQPDARLSEFEDGTWVKITKGGYSQYGSIWSSEESRPYLLTSEPVPLGSVQIVEADSIQLLQMQREAFSRLQNESNPIAERLSNIILKKGDLTRSSEIFSALSFYDRRVSENSCQAKAVKKALAESQRDMFFLIHGPPGTGKTTVITEILKHLADTGRKVLITSHTNVAVNNVMENLALSEDYSSYLKSKMVRLGPKAKVSKILKDLVPTTHDELIKIAVSQIVGATLSKLSILVLNGKLSFDEPYFDTVIVDESSMATIPLTLAGILLGKTFILVGDHWQLPPITRTLLPPSCPSAENCRLCESMFRLLIELYPERSQMLTIQFRSHPAIMGFSSKFVYERFVGRGIESAEECLQKKLKFEKVCQEQIEGTVNEKPVCYVDMHYEECPIEWYPSGPEIRQQHKRPSCFNELEATITLKIRHDLIRSGLPPERVWIITPFRLQRDIIKKAIRGIYGMVPEDTVISIYENLLASTVDSIQGKENDVIMYSLTWVPSVARERSVHKALKDVRRLNVALTRAKKKLIVIGDLAKLSWQYPYGPLKGYMNEHGAVVLAPEIRKDDDFLTVVRYYFGKKKNGRVDEEVQRRFREAKKRIRKDVSVPSAKPRVWRVENENDFQSFKESDLWEDLSLESKRRIYEKRMMGKPFEVMEVYEGAGQKRAVYLKAYKQYGVFQKELLEFV
jgi:superfamily I DNA and/or RNA helicase